MGDYLGIIIEQSLRDPTVTKEFRIVAMRRVKSWVFLLAAVPEDNLEWHVKLIQSNMVTDDPWYAHYFREDIPGPGPTPNGFWVRSIRNGVGTSEVEAGAASRIGSMIHPERSGLPWHPPACSKWSTAC
jgi:hypothetical protein